MPNAERKFLFGACPIDVLINSIAYLLFTEILNPFYVLQLFAILLWYKKDYEIYQTRQN